MSLPVAPRAFVPFLHVFDVPASVAFYQTLGFTVGNTFAHPAGDGGITWAWLENGRAQLMLAKASGRVDAEQQAVMFWVYYDDVAATRTALLAAGIPCGEIATPFWAPRGEFRITDPDGYGIMVSHT